MEGDNKNKQKTEECLLCNVSKETIGRLKGENAPRKEQAPKKKKRARKVGVVVLVLALVIGGLVVYKLASGGSPLEAEVNLAQETPPEENISVIGLGSPSGDNPPSSTGIRGPSVLASDFTTEDVRGNKFSLSDFRGETPVLLVFWATWCGFCAQELEDLKYFTAQREGEIQVLVLPSGETRETIKDYIDEKDINFLMLLDEQKGIWNQYLVRGTPYHFLINKAGEVVTVFPGLASADNLETMLRMVVE